MKRRTANDSFLFYVCMLACSILLLSGCSLHDTTSQKHYVAVIAKSTTSAFWKAVAAGSNAAATEYNLTVTFDGPDNEEDYVSQNQMIEQAVADGAEVIVFSAVDYLKNAEAINKAVSQGVRVIVIDSDVNSDKVSQRIGTNNKEAGRMAGAAALSGDEAKINIGIVNFDKNSENGQAREMGFLEAVKEDQRATVVGSINVKSTIEDAKKGCMKLLKNNPNINVIATFNEWTSLGVGRAIEELKLKDKTRVVAFDSNIESVDLLETGEVDALIVQNPYAMGYLGTESAYRLLIGKELGEGQIDTATTLVTRENMYLDEYQKVLFSFED